MNYDKNEYEVVTKEEFVSKMLKFYSNKRRMKTLKEKKYVMKHLKAYADDDNYDNSSIIMYARKRFSKEDYNDIMNSYYG